MEAPKPNAPIRKPRWLKTDYSFDQLNEKRIFAVFTTNDGMSYEGKGIIRAHEHPDGRLAVDLVFTRHDSAYKHTDILFHLSPRQLSHLQKSEEDDNYDFKYAGQLMPDNDSDESEEKE